ncbi:MAG: hypothetical protein Ct9H300mP8_02090 [Gammaproteobacteria bacterium]|nr:MAG: hypothetical protein Ct9H300mP8_02090 [Gammaproteobacteria bacterium]
MNNRPKLSSQKTLTFLITIDEPCSAILSRRSILKRFKQAPLENFQESDRIPECVWRDFRYLRYLRVRRRIKATPRQQYGRLSKSELPEGELGTRSDRERRRIFLRWVQDPDKLIYDDNLNPGVERVYGKKTGGS